ncbi:MAG: nucleotide-binding protein [Ruminococcus flavefaciens]|nr:nucleotide-binding protein [Ruminococcus flavefaciens]
MTKDKPQVFVASSVEGLDVAYAVQELLEHNAECTVWDQGVFEPSSYIMIDLIERLKISDYGIFVFSIDDTVRIRGEEEKVVRDNVILELGLFMGAIGQKNCFIIIPNSNEKIHLPTDLTGITLLKYNAKRKDGNLKAALGPSVNKIRNVINSKSEIKKVISQDVIEQIDAIGLSAFYSSRDDYNKYRVDASSIDRYINRATESICMVSITLATGIPVDDICQVFATKLIQNEQFKVTVSLLNPYNSELYKTIMPLFKQDERTLQENTISAIKTLVNFRASLEIGEQERFIVKVHQTLPFGSAIILDGDTENGTIQIETKPYNVGMRKSFAFEIENNGGAFFKTLKQSYCKLIDDGILWNELPLK